MIHGPWENYQQSAPAPAQDQAQAPAQDGPWNKYKQAQPNTNSLTTGTVQQVAGPVPTKEYFKNLGRGAIKGATLQNLTPEEQNTPGMELGQTAGSMVPMGVATAASTLIPGAGAAMPFVRAGLAGATYGTARGVVNNEPPKQIAKNAATDAAGFIVGEGIAKGAGKLLHPFSGSVTPAAQAATEIAAKNGIEAPVSNISESKMLQAGERVLEYSPFGTAITRQRETAIQGLKDMAEKVGQHIGPDRPPEVTGNLAKQALGTFEEAYKATKDKLYNAVMPILKDAPVQLDNTIQALKDVIARRSGTGEPAGINQVKTWLKELSGKEANLATLQGGESGAVTTFGGLRNFRTNVGGRANFNDPAVSGLKADMESIYAAASQDLDNAASSASPEVKQGLAKADEFFQQGKSTLKSKVFKAINAVNPENVHKVVIIPNSPSQVQIGKEILGDNFKDVARQWFDSGIAKASNPDGTISPPKVANFLKKYGSTVDAIAEGNPVLTEQFDNLKKVSDLLGRGRNTTQGSQTGFVLGSAAHIPLAIEAVRAAFTNPALALKILAGVGTEALGVGAMTSDVGRKYLTTGYPQAAKVVTNTVRPVAQAGISGLSRHFNK